MGSELGVGASLPGWAGAGAGAGTVLVRPQRSVRAAGLRCKCALNDELDLRLAWAGAASKGEGGQYVQYLQYLCSTCWVGQEEALAGGGGR